VALAQMRADRRITRVTPLERVEEIRASASALLADLKAGTNDISVSEARVLRSRIRETRGWLWSALAVLDTDAAL